LTRPQIRDRINDARGCSYQPPARRLADIRALDAQRAARAAAVALKALAAVRQEWSLAHTAHRAPRTVGAHSSASRSIASRRWSISFAAQQILDKRAQRRRAQTRRAHGLRTTPAVVADNLTNNTPATPQRPPDDESRLVGVDEHIIAGYARGMSVFDIRRTAGDLRRDKVE
jgi:hypothetical protein